MSWLVFGAIVPSFLLAWAIAFAIRNHAASWGLVDHPGERKVHAVTMPLGGGLAIWLGVLGPLSIGQLVLCLVVTGYVPEKMLPEIALRHASGLFLQCGRLWILLAAATVMMILGLIDDLCGVSWRIRLCVQTTVAVWMVWQGWRLTVFLDWPLFTGALSVLWIVALTNCFNMLDNMDGLSAGVASIAASFLAAVMLLAPDPATQAPQLFVAGFLLVLVGSLIGFLWHNHPPARIFMGDAGSYFIGFCLATITLSATFTGGNLPRHAILAPLCALAVPLYDTCSVLAIRLSQGRSLFLGDKSHFSHRLVEIGLSNKHAVWTIYLVTATCGLAALLLHQVDMVGAGILILLIGCVLAIVAILESAGRRRG